MGEKIWYNKIAKDKHMDCKIVRREKQYITMLKYIVGFSEKKVNIDLSIN